MYAMTKLLGSALRDSRRHMKLTQDQVAKRMGVSRAAVGQWENGEDPSTENLIKVCDVLGIELQSAIEGVMKHKEGFEAVKIKAGPFSHASESREPTELEKYPLNGEDYFIKSNQIPFFPTFAIEEGTWVAVSESPMFFAPRPKDVPNMNGLYMLGIVTSNMEPLIRNMSIIYADSDGIPSVGDPVIVRIANARVGNREVLGMKKHKSQTGLIGTLIDFSPDEIMVAQTNPPLTIPLATNQIAGVNRILLPHHLRK